MPGSGPVQADAALDGAAALRREGAGQTGRRVPAATGFSEGSPRAVSTVEELGYNVDVEATLREQIP